MPRIQAPTVAEHRARQRRAILDAARAHLAEEGRAPSLAQVGARAGLARSSVYDYFDSRDDLLAAVVADVFPDWAGQVTGSMEAADTPGGQVWAYVEANLTLFAGSEQAVARALTSVVDPSLLAEPVSRFHQSLQEPLVAALEAHGEAQPQLVADIIDSMVVRVSRDIWEPAPGTAPSTLTTCLELLERLLKPYLLPAGSRAS
ncbi:TetR family transcriptional regulator [Terrabacter tumescens]|uniref:TetR family transcriptional regulator n=1 Tax=Terrabacter tumescens TaxID=60443 RepID=A0ABQ2HX13_9MICO|nr:TetR/AcrR family transcriptional regulator [Terrabacter tumescens]GGM94182.1 TetR family transcriptional regulator [Terrabacter tumescens]